MGRMLEYLVRGKHQSPESAEAHVPTERAAGLPVENDDCPYIEVGDPDKKIDGSPSVLSSPNPGQMGVPHPGQMGVPHPPHVHYPQAPKTEKPQTPAEHQAVQFERWVRPTPESCPISAAIVAYHHPADAASRQYCHLLDQIWREKNKPTALLFRSANPQAATATVMLNVAVSCCFHHHRRVVVVGADFAQPEIRRQLGLQQDVGLSDVIDGDISLKDVVQKTAVPHLYAITEGTNRDADVDVAEAASWALNWLRQRYDLVLIAGPSMSHADGATPWMPHTDGVLLVGEQSQDAAQLARISEAVDRAGGTLQGFIHTSIRK